VRPRRPGRGAAAAFLEKQQRPDQLVANLLQAWRSPPAAVAPPSDHLAEAFERAPLPTALVGADDRILSANPAMCRLTGFRRDELVARTMADLIHPEDREAAEARGDVRLLRADEAAVWVSASRAPAGDEGPGGRFVVQLVDVSDRKRRISELTRSNAELSSFAFLAAHELKAPLQSLVGFTALLDRVHGTRLDAQGQEFVRWISDGAARMDALIEDLLAYCSVDTADPVVGPVPLDDVLADALGHLEGEVAARGAVVCAGGLPVVTGDPAQLGQLLQNLLANALKFVPEGRPPRIEVSAERDPEGWTVTVADNGIGVDPCAGERIFTMFQRLHPRERYKGTGIGLSICKRIVERRGGTIWVEPAPGGGSRFRFRLPDVMSAALGAPAG
jgi:PAS domain S-box-containing protein